MGNGENSEERQWAEIKEINGNLSLIKEHMAEMKGDLKTMGVVFETHIKDKSIHQRSPCDDLKEIQKQKWGVAGAIIMSLGAAIWSLLK